MPRGPLIALGKKAAEIILCRTGVAARFRRRHAGDTLILAYHNIVPDGERTLGDLSLHLPQRSFARQLDLLARTHDVVPLAALAQPGEHRRPRAVITFDDACQGAVVAGAAELARRDMPATIFVAPAFVGGRSFWWDAVAERGGAGIGEAARTHALTELQGSDARVRAWAATAGLQLRDVPWHQTAASEAQLRDVANGAIKLGSHSWSHPNLTTLSDGELADELARPLAWLRERFEHTLAWLAYPYGFLSPSVAAAAHAAGYDGALRVSGGWHRHHGSDPFAVPRLNIPAGLSLHGFELRVSGVIGG